MTVRAGPCRDLLKPGIDPPTPEFSVLLPKTNPIDGDNSSCRGSHQLPAIPFLVERYLYYLYLLHRPVGAARVLGRSEGERLTRWLDLAYHESERFSNETQAWERPAVSRVSR